MKGQTNNNLKLRSHRVPAFRRMANVVTSHMKVIWSTACVRMFKVIVSVILVIFMLGLGMSSPLTASTITNTKNVNPLSSVGRVNLTLNGAILVYQRYLQTKWNQGFIYYNLSAYYVNNHLIYLLCSHLTANGNGGYWLAGNEGQYGGHNTGSSSFEEPLGFTLGYMEQSEKFIKYNPMNDICQ